VIGWKGEERKGFRVENGGYKERMERRREKRVRVVQKTLIQTVQILRANHDFLGAGTREPEHVNR